MSSLRFIVLLAALISLVEPTRAQVESARQEFESPSLQSARWITDEKIERFEAGKTYVLYFWSTWSEPCRRAMPKIAALKREVGQSLTFIAVNVWEYDEIGGSRFDKRAELFLKREPGALPMPVCVDDAPGLKGSLSRTWLKAAGIQTLPTCVVIGEHGDVVWSGHPSELRRQLASKLPLNAKSMEDYLIEAESTVRRFLVASRDGDASAIAIAREAAAGDLRDNPAALNAFAWEMLDHVRFVGKDPALALEWASHAATITNHADGMILDTLALALFENGRISEAVKTQEEAVRLFEAAAGEATEELTDMKSRLKRFQTALESAR